MTPSLHTLACGVAMAQMEGVVQPGKSSIVNQDGVYGGLFEKASGGQLAVLWSVGGRRTIALRCASQDIDACTLFGKASKLHAEGKDGAFVHRVELDAQPVYLHLSKPGFEISPSPVIGLERSFAGATERQVKFTLVNRSQAKWSGAVEFSSSEGIVFKPQKVEFTLEAGARQAVAAICAPPDGLSRGAHVAEAATTLPDGSRFVFPLEVDVRPGFVVKRLPEDFSLQSLAAWKAGADALSIDRPEQVAIGRPPEMTSLQEERYWKGPDELSAKILSGCNSKGLFIRVDVRDRNKGPLKTWPGVEGSCVELFFDLRSPAAGLGSPSYGKEVAQLIVKPPLKEGEKAEIWAPPFNTDAKFSAVECAGASLDASSYWIGVFVPWTLAGANGAKPEAIGFDAAIDGPPANAIGRKSQAIMFGGASNNRDASGFGLGKLK